MFNTQPQALLKFFTCFHNIAINNGVLKLNKEAHLVLFIGPRASISCDLLALTDFYWPRANGPVLVSIPVGVYHCTSDTTEVGLQYMYRYL